MAAIAVTATSVVPSGSTYTKQVVTWGTTVTAGQVVYQKVSSGSLWWPAQADGTQEESGYGVTMGYAMSGGSVNQLGVILTSGTVTCGGTVAAGEVYFVHGTAGSFGVRSELASTNYVTTIGQATTTAIINIAFNASGVALA